MGSPIGRRTIHVTLGFFAFVCVVMALSFGKSSTTSVELTKLSNSSNGTEKTTRSEIVASSAFHLGAEDPISAPSDKMPLSQIPSVEETPKMAKEASNKIASTEATSVIEATTNKESASESTKGSESNSKNNEIVSETTHSVRVRRGDTLSKIFSRLGVSTKDIHEILTTNTASRKLAALQPGQTLKLRVSKEQQLAELVLDLAPGSTLMVSRLDNGFQVEQKQQPLEKQLAFGKGQIRDSLFLSGKRAGLDQKVIAQMVEIFGWNIDFALDLQPSDTFRVLYEEKCLDGERIETGNILAAEIVNDGKQHLAVRYTDNAGRTGYFSPDGYGMHQAFLRSPVNYTRISSHFGTRNHPILHRIRQHKGVDYSAPHGTPVLATSHGKVVFVGTRGGYGKVVELQHGSRYSTLYGHLSRFPKTLKVGAEVKQGQVIGFVGRTGLASGDHLHYEFRIDGIHHDPLTVALPKKSPIPDTHKRHFLAHSKEMIRLLDLHEHKVKMALNNFFSYE